MNDKFVKNGLIAWWLTWWALLAANSAPAAVANTYNLAAWSALWITRWVENILKFDWWTIYWTLAPFAMPMVWALAWYKLADAMEIENKALKFAANAGWVLSWAVIGSWALPYAPIVAAGGVALLWYKVGKWWLRKTWIIKSA